IPRPRNAFMIYRSTVWAQQKIPTGIERDHRHISRIIGHCWNSLPEEQKRIWRAKAEEEKQEHLKKYPGYRYSP
ncbi:HMG-box, partial [Thelephora ganbajun]